MTSQASYAKSNPDWLSNTTITMTTDRKVTYTTASIDKTIYVDEPTTRRTRGSTQNMSTVLRVDDHTTEPTRGLFSQSYRTNPTSTVTSSKTSPKAGFHSHGQ